MKSLQLLKNQTSNIIGDSVDFIGGRLHLVISGNLDGANVKYQVSYDNGESYHDYLMADNNLIIQNTLGKALYLIEDGEVKIRAVLLDAGSNTNITIRGYYNQYYAPVHNLIALS